MPVKFKGKTKEDVRAALLEDEPLSDIVQREIADDGSLGKADFKYKVHYGNIATAMDDYNNSFEQHLTDIKEGVGNKHKTQDALYMAIVKHLGTEVGMSQRDLMKVREWKDLTKEQQTKIKQHLRNNYDITNEQQLRNEIIGELREGLTEYSASDVDQILNELAGRKAGHPLTEAIQGLVSEDDYMAHATPKGHIRKFVNMALKQKKSEKRVRSYASAEAINRALGESVQQSYTRYREGRRAA